MLWVLRILLISAMCSTVIFIFSNSMMPPAASSEQSSAVEDFIDKVVPDEVPIKDVIMANVRKIAHFSEYGLLGIEVALYALLFLRNRLAVLAPMSLLVPMIVGFIDESIQQLTGRGPLISDVWIDIGGFAFFSAVTYALGFAALSVYKAVSSYRRRHSTATSVEDNNG